LSEFNAFLETKEKLRATSKESVGVENEVVEPVLERIQALK